MNFHIAPNHRFPYVLKHMNKNVLQLFLCTGQEYKIINLLSLPVHLRKYLYSRVKLKKKRTSRKVTPLLLGISIYAADLSGKQLKTSDETGRTEIAIYHSFFKRNKVINDLSLYFDRSKRLYVKSYQYM